MKEINKPEEVQVEDKPIEVKPEVKLEVKMEGIKEVPPFRPFMGHRKEELIILLEKWRDMYNSVSLDEDKNFSRKKMVEIERELKRRP